MYPGLATSSFIAPQVTALRLSTYVTGARNCAGCLSSLTGNSIHSGRRRDNPHTVKASLGLGVHVIG